MVRWGVVSITLVAALISGPEVRAEVFGDWFAEAHGPTSLYAASANEAGNVFGQFCYLSEGSCVWLIGVKTRCQRCGRARAYLRRFGLCRLCFRELALNGMIPGVRKASW